MGNKYGRAGFVRQSQEKYFAALEAGIWEDEIAAVELMEDRLVTWFTKDEHPRKTTIEKLGSLKPAFKRWVSYSKTQSGINDGAAAMLLAGEEAVKAFNLQPMARIVSMVWLVLIRPSWEWGRCLQQIKTLKRAGLSVKDIDLVELNEAFASQSLACIKEPDFDNNKTT